MFHHLLSPSSLASEMRSRPIVAQELCLKCMAIWGVLHKTWAAATSLHTYHLVKPIYYETEGLCKKFRCNIQAWNVVRIKRQLQPLSNGWSCLGHFHQLFLPTTTSLVPIAYICREYGVHIVGSSASPPLSPLNPPEQKKPLPADQHEKQIISPPSKSGNSFLSLPTPAIPTSLKHFQQQK